MQLIIKLCAVLGFFIAFLAMPAVAQNSGLQSLRTSDQSRQWDAVGRLNIGSNSICSGALIEPDLVLTAAHCLFDRSTGVLRPAHDIEFAAGLRNGRPTAYRRAVNISVHEHYRFTTDVRPALNYDLALVRLESPIENVTVTPFLLGAKPAQGAEIGVASYGRDRADTLSLQERCQVLRRQFATLIMSCDIEPGSSGAPVFEVQNGELRIVSVISAMADIRGQDVSIGTSVEGLMDQMMAELQTDVTAVTQTSTQPRRLRMNSQLNSTGARFVRP
ncbi:trypsin-like serine peptidase [Cochlodiniinecator piscidefendens]|uniref:trypsin-like serine peptidase n=1 Tax=Cochlodiniinecator piscidefendens TaxID=2715756 RepID=UPI00140DCA08|nr:S1 family peptidase [Cochlodiniinecator piscidefendens]